MNSKTAKLLRAYGRLVPSRLTERQQKVVWSHLSPEQRARATAEMRSAISRAAKQIALKT